MASFFEDFQEKQKKNRKTTMGSTMKTVTQMAKETTEQKKAATKPTTRKTSNTTTKSSTRASALVDRHTDSKGRLYTPLDYLRLDAKNGNTASKKIQQARANTTPESRAQTRERVKQEAEENRRRKQELRKIRISNYDRKNLNSTGQQMVREAKSAYDAAKAAGDRAGMAEAHAKAELTRKQYGYSGGAAGDEYISPELSRQDRVGLNEDGIRQVKKARMDYEAAKQAGDKEGMKAAIRRETEIRRNLRRAASVQGPRTDAYGREIWSGDREREMERMVAGVKAAGTGMAGSVLSLLETAAKSTDNYVLEQNRDYIEKTANDLDSWRAKLKLAQQGQGDPSWGSIAQLEQRVRIAENLDKLRRSGSTVDPNALGQRLMRQSQEYTMEATRGLEGPDRFLTETAISIGQNLPGMAAAAIPVVGPAVGATLLGTQAAGAKAFELNERGIAPDEALQRGLISGGIELATERIPLGSLAKLLGGKSGTNAAKNILKQMGIEASEESASYVANYVADKIAKDPKAEWSWQELMENAAAGAVSGGVFGTAGSMIGELRQKATGTNVQNQVQDVERTAGTGVNQKALEEMEQAKGFLPNRRDDLMGQVIRDYQEGNLEAAARAEVDRSGVEALVDGYLGGNQDPKLAEFTRRMQAYEDREAQYSFKRAGDTVARQAQQIKEGDAATFKTGGTEDGRLPGDAESPSNTSIPGTEGESNGELSTKGLSSYERTYETAYGKPMEEPKTVKESEEQAYVGIIDRLQRMEVPKPKERKVPPLPTAENKPLVKPSEIHEETISAEDMAYMDELMDAAKEESAPAQEKRDKRNDRLIEEAERLIPGGEEEKPTLGEQIKDATGFAYRKLVDSGEEIRKAGKQSGDKYLYSYYNQAKASTAIAQNMIAMRQSDVNGKEVGESLVSIFGPIKKKGTEYFKEFESYLLHRHNIDRMGTKEDMQMLMQAKRYLRAFDWNNPEIASMSRAELEEEARNGGLLAKERLDMLEEKARWESIVKPVFGYQVTAEISQGRVKELEGMHPEFKELAERVYGYSRNLMQYRVDSGLIDQRTADHLQKRYPHYVPTFRKQDGVSTAPREKEVRVGKTIKRAKGSGAPLIDIDKAMAQQTMSTVREGSKNRFGQRLLSDKISQDYVIDVQSVAEQKKKIDLEEAFRNEQTTKDNTFTVYQDGRAYEITMTPEMFEGIKGLTPTGENDKRAMKAVITANNIYKKAITSWNPIFTLKNWLKDFQDALLYTSDFWGFAKNYFGPAIKQIATNGDEWKLYQALGGTAASVYNSDKGVELPKDSKWAKLVGKISAVNLAVEQWPRLAEFMATAHKGNRTQEELMEAMYNAADITTNFGRSGQATKWLNATFVPFLNPSIQGFDKLVRTVRDNPRAIGPWVVLIGKAAALGIAPAIINAALFGGEDDYEELNQRDLDGNFMLPARIFRDEWDGMWIKVPRGRALTALGAAANAGSNLAKGKEVDPGELIDTIWTNVGVINPLSGHILKSWSDAALFDKDNPGKTWYGSDIETMAMQNKKPGERYNEKTDILSKSVGGKLGLSPAKINYLLDSYTGVFGDLALPLLTPTNPVGKNPLAKSFVVDSTTSNRLSGDFYDLGDELKYAEQDGSAEATIAYDYWNKVSQELSNVNEEIRKMENDLSLDSKDKRKKYRDLKAKANEIIRAGMRNVGAFQEAAAQYAGEITEDNEEDIFLKVTREVLGAQTALEYAGKDTYEKAQSVVEEGGDYVSYYDYLQMERTLGKVLDANSKLNKLNERGITGDTLTEAQTIADQLNGENQELMDKSMTGSNGWKPTEGDRKLSILESMNLPEEEAFAIWKMKILDDDGRWKLKVMEEAGLPAIEYYRYKMAVKHLNGKEDPDDPGTTLRNSRKYQRLPVINSLNLTTKQKDLLWFDNEWSEKTLYWQAPWH